MSELVERLRLNADCDSHENNCYLRCLAAGEIAELEAERDTAARALWEIVGMIEGCPDAPRNPDSLPQMVLFTARAALSKAEGKE